MSRSLVSGFALGLEALLSPCLTNRAALQQISLLPISVNIMSPDLEASVCARASGCVCVCVFLGGERGTREERGGENPQEIRDLLITLCGVFPSLSPSFFPLSSSFPLSLSIFSGSSTLFQFIYRRLLRAVFWLSSVLQTPSDLTSLKTSFQRLIERNDVSLTVMEAEHEGNKHLHHAGPLFL